MNELLLLCMRLIAHSSQASKDSDSATGLRLSLPLSAHLLCGTVNSKHCLFWILASQSLMSHASYQEAEPVSSRGHI